MHFYNNAYTNRAMTVHAPSGCKGLFEGTALYIEGSLTIAQRNRDEKVIPVGMLLKQAPCRREPHRAEGLLYRMTGSGQWSMITRDFENM